MSESAETINAQRVELGRLLQKARDDRKVTLAAAEAATRIRVKYLAALESGDYDLLPGDVTTRGFLRNYAQYLGLDPSELIQRFRTALPAPAAGSNWVALESTPSWQMEQRPASMLLDEGPSIPYFKIFLTLVVIGILAGAGWYINSRYPTLLSSLLPQMQATSTPTPTVTSFVPAATRTTIPTATVVAATATSELLPLPTSTPTLRPTDTVTPTPTIPVAESIDLKVRVLSRSWLQVTADGQVVFAGLLEKDEERSWQAQEVIRLDVGNAAGVEISINGTSRGSLGSEGQVVRREWTLTDGSIQEFDLSATVTAEAGTTTTPTVTETPKP